MDRLHKVMARAGVASRRKCEQYILDGRVKVNGETVHLLGLQVDPSIDLIKVDDKPLEFSRERKYIIINKPVGYLTTVKDPFRRPIVLDLLDMPKAGLFPVGRLDRDSEGVLILTNDGELAYRLTHPKFRIERTYVVEVRGHPNAEILNCLRRGIILEDGVTAPAKVDLLKRRPNSSNLEIIIREGRKRQVRRMCDKVGHSVIKLRRIAIGPLTIGNLRVGEYRPLTPAEVTSLKKAVGLR